jgi:uncharacterized protein YjiS (DUF1127 family)
MCSPGWRSRPPAQTRRQLSTHESTVANPPSSTNSLWEHLMSNSPQLANRTALRDKGQGSELRLEACKKTGAAREHGAQPLRLDLREMSSGPSIMPAATPADHENAASSSSMFASFGTAFALHGVSYCNLLHAIATSPVETCFVETEVERLAVHERRGSLAVISPSARPKLMESGLEQGNRARPGSEPLSENAGLTESCRSSSSIDQSNHRNWLTGFWSTIASRWVRWRREREIKKAAAALLALDDRTLRDIGIPHRSQVEQLVRYCFDC